MTITEKMFLSSLLVLAPHIPYEYAKWISTVCQIAAISIFAFKGETK